MEIKILSPSYKRAGECVTHEYLPKLHYVVGKSEAKEYKKVHGNIIIVPDKVQGNLARVYNWMLDNCGENIVIIDDDLKNIGRFEEQKSKKLNPEQVYEFIEKGFIFAKQLGVVYWGMNCLMDKGAYREYTPFGLTSYIGGPFQAHRSNPLRYDLTMTLKEDYDMTLQVLNKFRRTLRFNAYHYNCKQHTNNGGCASYRTVELERRQNKKFQKKWGSKIVRFDKGNAQVSRIKEVGYDINPIIKVPIAGV